MTLNREQFGVYLSKFNSRDYDGALDYFADEFELAFMGDFLRSRNDFKRFYAFFHDHVDEEIIVRKFISNDDMIAMEAIVKVTAKKDLTKEAGAEQGFKSIIPMKKGDVFEVPEFIHYHIKNGKFVRVGCALFEGEI